MHGGFGSNARPAAAAAAGEPGAASPACRLTAAPAELLRGEGAVLLTVQT